MCATLSDPRHYTEGELNNVLIYYASSMLNARTEEEHALWKDALLEGVRDALSQEDSLRISVALALAPSARHYQLVWQAIRDVIELPDQPRHAVIFAVPIILVVGTQREIILPTRIEDVDGLNNFMFERGLFASGADVFLSGKLLQPDALVNITPAQLYRYTRQLVDAGRGLPLKLEPLPVKCQHEGVFLRYLLGTAMQAQDQPPVVRLGGGVEGWGRAFMTLLGEWLKVDGVTLFPIPRAPMTLMEAIVSGQSARLEVALQVFASTALRAYRDRKHTPRAVLSSHAEGEIHFTLSALEEIKEVRKFVWPLAPLDNVALIEANFRQLMAECQVREVTVMPGVQPS